jgi:hypothetical protein
LIPTYLFIEPDNNGATPANGGMKPEAADFKPANVEMNPDMAGNDPGIAGFEPENAEMEPEDTDFKPEITEMKAAKGGIDPEAAKIHSITAAMTRKVAGFQNRVFLRSPKSNTGQHR